MAVMIPLDTSPDAHAVHVSALRSRTGSQRVRMALSMSEELRAISRSGIRSRHPAYSEEEVSWALFRLLHGDELFTRAWPAAPLLAP